jgi:hypothetical protein
MLMQAIIPEAAVAVLMLSLNGCSLQGCGASVTVLLPPLPPQWAEAFPGAGFRVVCANGNGQLQCISTRSGQSSIQLSCSKAFNTPLLAYPLIQSDQGLDCECEGLLRPAGALFPASAVQGDGGLYVQLTWRDGPAALVLHRLLSAGMDVSLVNAQRLCAYLDREEDPWDLDLDRITGRLARGEFNAYDIDLLPRRTVILEAGRGTWVLESPFRPAVCAESGGALRLENLSLGLHTLLSPDGRRIRLGVNASELIVIR